MVPASDSLTRNSIYGSLDGMAEGDVEGETNVDKLKKMILSFFG